LKQDAWEVVSPLDRVPDGPFCYADDTPMDGALYWKTTRAYERALQHLRTHPTQDASSKAFGRARIALADEWLLRLDAQLASHDDAGRRALLAAKCDILFSKASGAILADEGQGNSAEIEVLWEAVKTAHNASSERDIRKALGRLANLYERVGEFDVAIGLLQRSLGFLAGIAPFELDSLFRDLYKWTCRRDDNESQAIVYYRILLGAQPWNREARKWRCFWLKQSGREDQVREMASRELSDDLLSLADIAAACTVLGDTDRAAKIEKRVRRLARRQNRTSWVRAFGGR
jgi:tetratricopeptide (TPR) repeat protein